MGRPRRQALTVADLVAAAIECTEPGGVGDVTVSRVAEHLGVKPPSLYNHVRGNDELRRLAALEGWRMLTRALVRGIKLRTGARSQLESVAHCYRRFAKRNRGLYRLMSEVPLDPSTEAFERVSSEGLAPLLQIYEATGMAEQTALHHIRTMRASLHGFIVLEASGQFQLGMHVEETFEYLVRGLIDRLPPAPR